MEQLNKHNKSLEFREAVDWETFGLYDYPQVIKNPMDIGKVKNNLDEKKYKTLKEWYEDVMLIWNNCK